ncbi:DUF397 domain-containing protein [Streptacidiphilus carbonis]|uniref:DUF397 domain-containing protein n=1 Tax=Streptacidiphilus carbonis TaxID=105422 RepID=UPI0005A89806|nr:DUF397 domain-containing protein [Streptacidiphilus carbonis]
MEQPPLDLDSLHFFKSSFSGDQGACVETAFAPAGGVVVRDSKQNGLAGQQYFRFTSAEWQAFVDGARSGEFDLPSA